MGLGLHDLLDNETFRKPPLISTRTIRIPDEGSRSRGAEVGKMSGRGNVRLPGGTHLRHCSRVVVVYYD